jgi:hypothetical protein
VDGCRRGFEVRAPLLPGPVRARAPRPPAAADQGRARGPQQSERLLDCRGDPESCGARVTKCWSRKEVLGLLLATDGATAAINYGLYRDWMDVCQVIDVEGTAALLTAVEAAEKTDPDGSRWNRSKPSDRRSLS